MTGPEGQTRMIDRTSLTGLYQFQIELPRRPIDPAAMVQALERAGITTNRNGEPVHRHTPP
jgi:hypothetical protein